MSSMYELRACSSALSPRRRRRFIASCRRRFVVRRPRVSLRYWIWISFFLTWWCLLKKSIRSLEILDHLYGSKNSLVTVFLFLFSRLSDIRLNNFKESKLLSLSSEKTRVKLNWQQIWDFEKNIFNFLLKSYIVYSIICDIIVVSGIAYLIFK